MATELTATAQIKSENRTQEPQLVLQIDGVETVFGIGQVKKFVRIGDPELFIDGSWKIGGLNPYEEQLDVIDLNASSNTIRSGWQIIAMAVIARCNWPPET